MKPILITLLLTAFLLPFTSRAQIYGAGNGLSVPDGAGIDPIVILGGFLFDAPTSIDFGSSQGSSSLLFKKGSSDYFFIANGGNIGIGTSSPGAKLHLVGTFKLADGSQGAGKVLTSDANGLASWQTPAGGGTGSDGLWTAGTGSIYNTTLAANVGIGTNTPGTKLDVSGAIRSNTSISVVNTYGATWDVNGTHSRLLANSNTDAITIWTSKGSSSIRLQVNNGARGVMMDGGSTNFLFMGGSGETLSGIGNANGTGNLILLYSTGANSHTEGARLTSSGNFGIGTTSPDTKLHVAGTFKLVDGTQGAGKVLTSDANGLASWQMPSGGGSLWTSGTGNIYNTTLSANVGIGTNTPSTSLHVKGQLRLENTNASTPFMTMYTNGSKIIEMRSDNGTGEYLGGIYIGRDAGSAFQAYSGNSGPNIALGPATLHALTGGSGNIAVGANSILSLTTGLYNVAIGNNAMVSFISGNGNIAIGHSSLASKMNGDYNTAIGLSAGSDNTGSGNIFLGALAGTGGGGNENIFIGYRAGRGFSTGNYNVIIGGNEGDALDGNSNHILLADGAGTERLKINNNGAYALGGGYGTTGQVLTSNGTGAAPSWQNATGGGSGGGFWTDGGSGNLYNTTQAGTVAIGLSAVPTGYKLAVAGNIIAEKVKTRLQASGWPDFVFGPGYKLPTLQQVEQFIQTNGHLPGVPSAKEIEKNGLDLGDNQAVLLKKIEELTLYVIGINKKLEQLQAENKLLKKKPANK